MSYTKNWENNPNINNVEKKKLVKDGLDVYNDIPYYAANGFQSIPEDQWDLFKWAGLYLQKPKEAGYFMMRVNVPSGILTNDQLVVLAEIARDYGRNVFDITTRQAVQFHWLTIEQMPDIFKRLEAVGLSSAGACGDILRNIVGNPLAGIDREELFDTTEIVKDVFEFFQFNKEFSNLPRKYKMSISSNVRNASNAQINCVSFVPATKRIDGELVKGFHIYVGGGLSAAPHLAQELDVFVRPEQTLEAAIGITTIFRDYGYREKRHLTRLKFLVANWGVDKFKEKLLEYVPTLADGGVLAHKEWNAGYFYGVQPQKQDGLNYIGFNVPVGRLHSDEVFEIARVAKLYGNGEVRTCNSQNLIIPNVPDTNVDAVLADPVFKRITIDPKPFTAYSVSCTGIEYCNLALVETKEKMKRVAAFLDDKVNLDVPVRMHMIGCPNSCGQRQIADVGIQGVKYRAKDRGMVEGFEVYIGGTLQDAGVFNQKLKGKVASDKLEEALEQFFIFFKNNKTAGESFYDWVQRVGVPFVQQQWDDILEPIAK